MKKLDNEGEGLISEGLTCDCCDEPVLKREAGQDFESEDTESKNILNDKFLIIIGLVFTAATVILELTIPHSFTTGFVMFVLATPVQFLLGRQFYIRFFRAIKNKKGFTTNTLVVLSTSVAYFYSLFTLFSPSETYLFFEASSSVLTIFTIGEYLERIDS